jgi:hypothetical protein
MSEQTTTITATVGAYLMEPGSTYSGNAAMLEAIANPDRHRYLLGSLLVYSHSDMSKTWARVGEATINVTFASHDEMVLSAIKSLNGQIEAAREQFMRTQATLLEQISKLQAIEYTPGAAQ